jgi:hypothetical protein
MSQVYVVICMGGVSREANMCARKKQFHQASEFFQQAIAMSEFSEIAQTHADIGMALANFPGLDAFVAQR